jgi:hypothetical protein
MADILRVFHRQISNTISSVSSNEGEEDLKHSLQVHCPSATKWISFVNMNYLEKHIHHPVPRSQDLPMEAYSELHGRAILCATSHAWFYQKNPDPTGTFLNMLKDYYIPILRKKYPHTDLLLFDDWMCMPQKPRKGNDDFIFGKAMGYMNKIYVYCDVVLFLDAPLPKNDMTLFTTRINPADYEWSFFYDSFQVVKLPKKEENHEEDSTKISEATKLIKYEEENNFTGFPSSSSDDVEEKHTVGFPPSKDDKKEEKQNVPVTLGLFDLVKKIDGINIQDMDHINRHKGKIVTVSFLRRPFGRANTIPPEKRGWLFLERVTTAIKAAAAGKESFDDIVLSNEEKIRIQIFRWAYMLRKAVRRRDRTYRLRAVLQHYEDELSMKLFTHPGDVKTVKGIMHELVGNFRKNWDAESRKQKSAARRTYYYFSTVFVTHALTQ